MKSHFVPHSKKAQDLIKSKKILGIEAPDFWSETAVEIAQSKYLRKDQGEKSIFSLVDRVVKAIAQSGRQQKYFASTQEARIFSEELSYILLTQRAFFNSPVWFNCGIYQKFKIKGEGPLWYFDLKSKKIKETPFGYVYPQCSACFIQKLEDSLTSIYDLLKKEARLFKFGSGSGSNFSVLRSKYEKLASGGTSSGLISFLDVFDRSAGVVKSGGVTRRAAKMVCVDVDHPEILDFIEWKSQEEKKVLALIKQGYSAGFEGEAYRSVSGQNANNSVRVTDAFMKAVDSAEMWELKSRTQKKVIKKIPAREIWQKIIESAWSSADPGLQFDTSIQKWHTCQSTGRIQASNPCSEFMFLDDTACNLASLNLVKFFSPEGDFLIADFIHTARVILIAQDILVDLSGYPSEEIAQNSHDYRPLGLGYANLGASLMRQGMSYGSEAACEWTAFITALMTGVAYGTSADLADQLGSFAGYKKNQKSMHAVLKKHVQSLQNGSQVPTENWQITKKIWQALLKKKNFRNSQVTVLAPTGTIGLVMDCDTMGIEPDYSLLKKKILAGGGELQLFNQSVEPALQKLGYDKNTIKKIMQELKQKGTLIGSSILPLNHQEIFASAGEISPEKHLLMMAAAQPFLSGAISKTVNMPVQSLPEDIGQVYKRAWQLGLKAVSVYRDQSKLSQPLTQLHERRQCPECQHKMEMLGGCNTCPQCGFTLSCG